MASTAPDSELKARHRTIWASGDYAVMVETWLLPLGPRLVEACGIGPGMAVPSDHARFEMEYMLAVGTRRQTS